MLSRNKEQELSFQIIYNYLFNEYFHEDKAVDTLIEEDTDTPYEEVSLFVKEVVVKALLHLDESIQLIKDNLINWKYDRLNRVTVAIIVLGLTEGKYIQNEGLCKASIIDVCVNLTKKYADYNDYRFVNGILDKLL